MPSPTLSPHNAEIIHRDFIDNEKRPSARDELRQNLAQLKLGEECLRRERLLGGAGNQDYETYSLPVSRVSIMKTMRNKIELTICFSSLRMMTAMIYRLLKHPSTHQGLPALRPETLNLLCLSLRNRILHIKRHLQPPLLLNLHPDHHMVLPMKDRIKLNSQYPILRKNLRRRLPEPPLQFPSQIQTIHTVEVDVNLHQRISLRFPIVSISKKSQKNAKVNNFITMINL